MIGTCFVEMRTPQPGTTLFPYTTLFRSESERRWASQELRWLADALGPARNLDVFETALLAPAHGAASAPAGVAALMEAAEERRRRAYRKAAWAVRSRRYTALLLRQRRWFEGYAWRDDAAAPALAQPIAELAGPILDRRRRVAKRRG